MKSKRQPKTVLAVLVGGTLLLVGGTALAVSLPAPTAHMMDMMAMNGTRSTASSVPAAMSLPASTQSMPAPTTSTPTPAPRATSVSPPARPTSTPTVATTASTPARTIPAPEPATTTAAPKRVEPATRKVAPGTTMSGKTKHAANAKKRPDLTYVVKKGDTLFAIAKWFKLHGYGDLYQANAKVVGSDPNLIHPGERITISSSTWSVKAPK